MKKDGKIKICKFCQKEFLASWDSNHKRFRIYCSRVCFSNAFKNSKRRFNKAGNLLCQRRGCHRIAIHKVTSKPTWYCTFHKKVHSARSTAAKRGKKVPLFNELEKLFLLTKKCVCGKLLNPFKIVHRTDPCSDIPTLQHNKNGTYSVLCLECNIKDGHSIVGLKNSLRLKNKNKKYCPNCRTIKSIDEFYSYRVVSSFCKVCLREMSRGRYYERKFKRQERGSFRFGD